MVSETSLSLIPCSSVRDADRKYVFEIASKPIVLRDQELMVHLMSRKDIKLAAVELVEKLGK